MPNYTIWTELSRGEFERSCETERVVAETPLDAAKMYFNKSHAQDRVMIKSSGYKAWIFKATKTVTVELA